MNITTIPTLFTNGALSLAGLSVLVTLFVVNTEVIVDWFLAKASPTSFFSVNRDWTMHAYAVLVGIIAVLFVALLGGLVTSGPVFLSLLMQGVVVGAGVILTKTQVQQAQAKAMVRVQALRTRQQTNP